MEHATDDLTGKFVVDPDGRQIGKVTAVDGDKLLVKGEDAGAARMADAASDDTDDTDERLSISADRIETVTDDTVQVGEMR